MPTTSAAHDEILRFAACEAALATMSVSDVATLTRDDYAMMFACIGYRVRVVRHHATITAPVAAPIMAPTHIVVDTRDGYVMWRTRHGEPFTADTAAATAAERNAPLINPSHIVMVTAPAG